MIDTKKLGGEIVTAIATFVDLRVRAVASRLLQLEGRVEQLAHPKLSDDERRAIVEAACEMVAGQASDPNSHVSRALSDVRKDAAAVDEATIIKGVLAAIPKPADGKDGAPGADGKSVAPEEVLPLIAAEVAKAVAAIPAPAPGRDGRDGLPGVPGAKGLDGSDGAHGADGKDGLGFEDMVIEHDGERGFTFKFQRGDLVKAFPFTLPIVLDRGVFKEGSEYQRGDAVSWGGSLWIAQGKTAAKPDGGDGTWRLSVKRGRDGKDGAQGEKGLQGPPGRDLRDFK